MDKTTTSQENDAPFQEATDFMEKFMNYFETMKLVMEENKRLKQNIAELEEKDRSGGWFSDPSRT